ncbi:MAG TPA: cell division protein ZapA [Polyangiaceae bacterium]|nr:cell division protein ZapA [Polyangiaceae bacterium]
MVEAPVEVVVGGKTYRVVASADADVLRHLARLVDAKLHAVSGAGRPITPQSMVLAALALAHDLEEERAQRCSVERRAREQVRAVIARIDRALAEVEAPAGLLVHDGAAATGYDADVARGEEG